MSDHISRGVFIEHDTDVPGELGDGHVMGDYYCKECDTLVRLRAREGESAYVRLGCERGATEVGLRVAAQIDGGIERDGVSTWDRRREGFDD